MTARPSRTSTTPPSVMMHGENPLPCSENPLVSRDCIPLVYNLATNRQIMPSNAWFPGISIDDPADAAGSVLQLVTLTGRSMTVAFSYS